MRLFSAIFTIIIVTFKSQKVIEKCLVSIDNKYPVIVIENSNDENFKKFLENKFSNVKCILTGENIGMGPANNIGIKNATTDFVLISNPDVCFYQDTIKILLNSAKRIKNFTILAPIIAKINNKFPNYGMFNKSKIEINEKFDRIVSVGMFEHVGINHYREYFEKIWDLLTDDGVAVIHTIGRAEGPGATNPWINKYIFPGGYSPALSEVSSAIERSNLYITDVEVFRLQYAETLRHWRKRFYANRHKVQELIDERFCRMWDFYLCGSEVAFRYGGHVVFQLQLTKQPDAVPQTRDYIFDEERKRFSRGGKSDSRAA